MQSTYLTAGALDKGDPRRPRCCSGLEELIGRVRYDAPMRDAGGESELPSRDYAIEVSE